MDLKDFKPTSSEIVVKIVDPIEGKPFDNDDGTRMTITCWAPHTKQYKTAVYKQAMARNAFDGDLDYASLEDASIDLLCDIIKDWNITIDGEKPEYDPAMGKATLEEIFWLKPQVEAALNEYEVFTKT